MILLRRVWLEHVPLFRAHSHLSDPVANPMFPLCNVPSVLLYLHLESSGPTKRRCWHSLRPCSRALNAHLYNKRSSPLNTLQMLWIQPGDRHLWCGVCSRNCPKLSLPRCTRKICCYVAKFAYLALRSVCTRFTTISKLHVETSTPLSSPLILPFHSIFPRV